VATEDSLHCEAWAHVKWCERHSGISTGLTSAISGVTTRDDRCIA
jgi:hypothetical protein